MFKLSWFSVEFEAFWVQLVLSFGFLGSGFIEGLGLRAYIGPGVWFRVDFGLRVWSLGCAWVSEVGHGTRSLSVANLSMAHE